MLLESKFIRTGEEKFIDISKNFASNKDFLTCFYNYLFDILSPMFDPSNYEVSYFFGQSMLDIIKLVSNEFKSNLIIMEKKRTPNERINSLFETRDLLFRRQNLQSV